MKDYFKKMLSDDKGMVSSKRIFTLFFAFLLTIAFVCNLFWNMTVDTHLVDAIMVIIISGFGITGIEKFAPSNGGMDPYSPVENTCPCQTAKGE
jgi:hypothetical protein